MFPRLSRKYFEEADEGKGGSSGEGDAGDSGQQGGGDSDGLLASHRRNASGGEGGEGGEGDGSADTKLDGPTFDQRPDWVNEKFWDAESKTVRLDALAKGYTELEKKLGTGAHKAPDKPEDYVLEVPEDVERYKKPEGDDPVESWFRQEAKELGLSKEQASRLFQGYIKQVDAMMPAPFDAEAELAKLGDKSNEILNNLSVKLDQFAKVGLFNEQDVKEFEIAAGTAEGMRMLTKLMEFYGDKMVPMDMDTGDGLPSKDELRQMKYEKNEAGQVKYEVDPDYRAKIDGYYEKIYGTEPAGTSR